MLDNTLIVMLTLPFGLIGGVWLLWALDYDLSVAVAGPSTPVEAHSCKCSREGSPILSHSASLVHCALFSTAPQQQDNTDQLKP